jgi:eukaryotic-like serine/threonine-protein kinase
VSQSLAHQPSAQESRNASDRRQKRRSAGRLLPARLGPYELTDHIGRGGMADIYRAKKKGAFGLEREVVLKEVLPEYATCDRMASLLAEEARIASRLEHPNIVRIEDLQREDGHLYIAMEYVEGLDLREALRGASRLGQRLPIEVSVFIVEEIAKALDYAHGCTFTNPSGLLRHGVIHRDVSPSNVLLSLDGEVKLCDFGIARSFDGAELDDVAIDLDGIVEGKAGYMSPEQARGETLDGRADIFAAGILLWELVAGRKLYKAGPGESLFDVARRGHVPPISPRGLPFEEELFAIIARATAFSRDDRWPTAAAMGEALGAWATRAGYGRRSFMLQEYLEATFGEAIREQRRRRELATRALGAGPVAVLEVVRSVDAAAENATAVEPAPSDPSPTPTSQIRVVARKKRKRSDTSRSDASRIAKTPPPIMVAPTPASGTKLWLFVGLIAAMGLGLLLVLGR